MSWASVVGQTKKGSPKKIQVVYNAEVAKEFKSNDRIPRNKEITPDPADDFIMTNQEMLPLSLEIMIKWREQLMLNGENKIGDIIIDLDFDEIDQDLKYQSKKYKNNRKNRKKLSRLYFNCCDFEDNDSKNKNTYFGPENDSLLHFLFNQLININKEKAIKQILMFLKLLFQHNIVDITEKFDVWDDAHFISVKTSCDKLWTQTLIKFFETEHSSQIIEMVSDIMIITMNIKKQTILTIERYTKRPMMSSKNILDFDIKCWSFYENLLVSTHKMRNNGIIEQLLFRGAIPFKFIEIDHKDFDRFDKYTTMRDAMNESMPIHIKQLLDEINIFEKTLTVDIYKPDIPMRQLAVLSPLILKPYINKARNMMNELLTKCIFHFDNGYIEITNVISSYLFNLDVFYDRNVIQNNINVQAIVFLNYLIHFKMDNQLIHDLKDDINNTELIKYLMDNYLYTLSLILASTDRMVTMQRFVIIRSLMETHKFPLTEDGIYLMITLMFNKITWKVYGDHVYDEYVNESRIELLMKFMKYVKDIYGKEFDINYVFKNDRFQNILKTLSVKDIFGDKSKLDGLSEFIGLTFKDDLDIEGCFGLENILKLQNFVLFKYYVIKYYDYSLENICKLFRKLIETAVTENCSGGGTVDWAYQYMRFGEDFLKRIEEFCISNVCENDKEKQLWQSTMKYVWEQFEKIKTK